MKLSKIQLIFWLGAMTLPTTGVKAQVQDFLIKQEMITGDCANQDKDMVSHQANFLRVLCEYHKAPRSTNVAQLNGRIETLQTAQTAGLEGPKQVLAGLIEGLSHCQLARINQGRINSDATARQTFCDARDNALAAFRDINWGFARIAYDPATGRDVDKLIEEYGACQEEGTNPGPINTKFNGTCGTITGVAVATQMRLVDDTFNELQPVYFGATSPLPQMFDEKSKVAADAAQDVTSRTGAAEAKAADVKRAYDAPEIAFRTTVEKNLQIVFDDYTESYALAKVIKQKYDEWLAGLLTQVKLNGDSEDLGQTLVGPSTRPTLIDQLGTKNKVMSANGGHTATIQGTADRIRDISKERENLSKNIKKLCGVYYCYIALGTAADSGYRRACKTPALFKKNALCEGSKGTFDFEGTATPVKDVCQSVGFDVTNFGKVGLAPDKVANCKIQ